MPWSNIEFIEICSLNRGVLIERLLRVSYVWYKLDMNLFCWNCLSSFFVLLEALGIVLFRF